MDTAWHANFIKRHRLPLSYVDTLNRWVDPLSRLLCEHQKKIARPILVALSGCQGSGKSTFAAALELQIQEKHKQTSLTLSIDDFYLRHEERRRLAEEVHPLLSTRGVPGTHDIALLLKTLDQLQFSRETVAIPRFDKASDDRLPPELCEKQFAPINIILLEGWCMGVQAQSESELALAVNELESDEDPDGVWRRYVNQQIQLNYQGLNDRADVMVMLKAPSFDCVYGWRLEQEQKLASRHSLEKLSSQRAQSSLSNKIMSPEDIRRFVQFYQRHTLGILQQLPGRSHCLYSLDCERNITDLRHPVPLT